MRSWTSEVSQKLSHTLPTKTLGVIADIDAAKDDWVEINKASRIIGD
jgi:hypothetical protein